MQQEISNEELIILKHHRNWKMRLIVALTMLILAFIGLVVTDLFKDGAWGYWRWMVPIFAILSIFLNWYLHRNQKTISGTTIWHEIACWGGLALAVYVISTFIGVGILARFQAALVVLTMLALTSYINGIYREPTFIAIGIMLGVFAITSAFFIKYIYTIILPLTLIVGVILVWIARKKH